MENTDKLNRKMVRDSDPVLGLAWERLEYVLTLTNKPVVDDTENACDRNVVLAAVLDARMGMIEHEVRDVLRQILQHVNSEHQIKRIFPSVGFIDDKFRRVIRTIRTLQKIEVKND